MLGRSSPEVVQRGNEISYFETALEPFTLNGDYIARFSAFLIYTDLGRPRLTTTLYFAGRTRIADCAKLSALWRAMPRYSHIVWMGDTKLPMRVDLLDRDETLAVPRYCVHGESDIGVKYAGAGEGGNCRRRFLFRWRKTKFNWSPSSVPQGFSEVESSRRPVADDG